MPGMSSRREPSIRMATRPSTYGGVDTTAPIAPPTALIVSFSRRERTGLTPISLAGTAT